MGFQYTFYGSDDRGRGVEMSLEELQATVANGAVEKPTWAALATVTGSRNGQPAGVPDSDIGTHADPVTSVIVPNAGRYSWSESPAGWQWLEENKAWATEAQGDKADTALQEGDAATPDQGEKAETAMQPTGLNALPISPLTHVLGHNSSGNVGRMPVLSADARAYGAVGSFYIDPMTRDIYDACSVKPTHMHLQLIDDVICMLRDWNLPDSTALTSWHLPLHNEADELAISNWLDVEAGPMVKSSAGLTFVPSKHWVGDGTLESLTLPQSAADLMTQNANSFSLYLEGANDSNSVVLRSAAGVENLSLKPRDATTGYMSGRVMNATETVASTDVWVRSGAQAGCNGDFGMVRTAADALRLHRHGYVHANGTDASSAPSSSPLMMYWEAGAGTPIKNCGWHFGKTALTEAQTRAITRIKEYYLRRAPIAMATGVPCPPEDIDETPIDDGPRIQEALDAGAAYVTISAPDEPWKTYWIGAELKVPSVRMVDGRFSRVKLMSTAPAGHNVICNTNPDEGNHDISIRWGRWWGNKGNRTIDPYDSPEEDRPGRSCISLRRVHNFDVKGNICHGPSIHCIDVNASFGTYTGETDWKDGTSLSAASSSFSGSITGNRCFDCGDDAITAHWTDKAQITGNHVWGGIGDFSDVGSSGIEWDDGGRGGLISGNFVWDFLHYSSLSVGTGSTGIICKGHGTSTHPPGSPSAEICQVTGNSVSHCFEGISAHNNASITTQRQALITGNIVEDTISTGIRSTGVEHLTIALNHVTRTCRDLANSGPIRVTGTVGSLQVQTNTIEQSGLAEWAINVIGTSIESSQIDNNRMSHVYRAIRTESPDMTVTNNKAVGGAPSRGTPLAGLVPAATCTDSFIHGNSFKGFTTDMDISLLGSGSTVDKNKVTTGKAPARLPGVWRALHDDATAYSNTGSTTKNLKASYTIPAHSIGPKGSLRISGLFTSTVADASVKQAFLEMNGVLLDTYVSAATSLTQQKMLLLSAVDEANLFGTGALHANSFGQSGAASANREINMAVDQTLTVSMQNALSADNTSFRNLRVEVLYGE